MGLFFNETGRIGETWGGGNRRECNFDKRNSKYEGIET